MSTSLLDLTLFNIRSLRLLSLGITEVASFLFLLANAIFEGHKELIADQWNFWLGTLVLVGKQKGKSYEHYGRFTDTWIRHNSEWICVASHLGLLQE